MGNIIVAPQINQNQEIATQSQEKPADGLTVGKVQQHYRENIKNFGKGVGFGFRGYLYKAFAIRNILENGLYKAEDLTREQFLEQIGIPIRTAERYHRIGKHVAATVQKKLELGAPPTFVTEKDFNTAFGEFFDQMPNLTIRGLDAASKQFESFERYIATGEGESEAFKQLESGKSDHDKQRELEEERISRAMQDDEHTSMHTLAAERGYKWNMETRKLVNKDDSPLTDDQRSELLSSDEFIRPWKDLQRKLSMMTVDVHSTIVKEGESYNLFAPRSTSKDRTAVREHLGTIKRIMKTIDGMITAFHANDMEAFEEVYRGGPIA